MSQFEYTDLNKFFVSIGIFLIGLTFILPWLFFRESFDLLIKADDLTKYTAVAQEVITNRQNIVSYFPKIILGISSLCFISGSILCWKGIRSWHKKDKLNQEASEASNKLTTEKAKGLSKDFAKKNEQGNPTTDERMILSSTEIPISPIWVLNHWGSDVASINKGKMIFTGRRTRLETDGCHIDLKNTLKVGSTYLVSCFVKSLPNSTCKFQLWCHDQLGIDPQGSEASIPYAVPTEDGGKCSVRFEAKFNPNIRIHLQYAPGEGEIEVSDVMISELNVSAPIS